MTKSIWSTLDINCPSPNNSDFTFTNWIKHFWTNTSSCNKMFQNLEEKIRLQLRLSGIIKIILSFVVMSVVQLAFFDLATRMIQFSSLYSIATNIFIQDLNACQIIKTGRACISILIGDLHLQVGTSGTQMSRDPNELDRPRLIVHVGRPTAT